MDRRSFLKTVFQTLSGIALAGASFLTLKTGRYISPLSREDPRFRNLFTQGTPPPPDPNEYQECQSGYGGGEEYCNTGQTFICADYAGPCNKEVICNQGGGEFNFNQCMPSDAYAPPCRTFDACPDTGTGASIHPDYCPHHGCGTYSFPL